VRTVEDDVPGLDTWILFDGDTIAGIGTGVPPRARVEVSAGGRRAVPGFIDLHCHGGGGTSFDGTEEDIRVALALHRAHGTTRSVLSLVSAPMENLTASLRTIAALDDPLILGTHLEGPFLAPGRKGAHSAEMLFHPTRERISRLLDAASGTLRQITIAPELPGALDAIEQFTEEGVICAIGHTEADANITREAVNRGARLITHAFNAMPALNHRDPGPLGAAFTDDRLVLELILDGTHVHPDVVRVAFSAAPDRIALITDAMAATGCADGHYTLGSLPVQVYDGTVTLADGTLAGSTLTLDVALRVAVGQYNIPLVTAIEALTSTPARALGLEARFGHLRPGYAADVVLLDADDSVAAVYAAGTLL
jgi:N-acetylglucosamine-6-phosphate deacetylase